MSEQQSLSFTCGHYTHVLDVYARFLEHAAGVSMTLHGNAIDEDDHEVADDLGQAVMEATKCLNAFLEKHDPDRVITRPTLVVYIHGEG